MCFVIIQGYQAALTVDQCSHNEVKEAEVISSSTVPTFNSFSVFPVSQKPVHKFSQLLNKHIHTLLPQIKKKKLKNQAFWSKAWQTHGFSSKSCYNRNTSLAFPPIQLLPCTDYSLVIWCPHLTVRPGTFLAYKTQVLRYLNGIIDGHSCAPIQGRAADASAEVC